MTVMEVEALSPVVTGLTTRGSSPSSLPDESLTSRSGGSLKVGPPITVAVQGEGAEVPDLSEVVEKINKLLALPAGWDSYRAKQISPEAVVSMLRILISLMDRSSLQPQLFPLPDGGLQAEWHVGGSSIEIEVTGDGQSGCALADGEEEVEVEFSFPSVRDQLLDFRRILSRFSAQVTRVCR
ncbi:hypothetical protein [Streptomyces lasiicapitis]|uniref:Uncharacterized protein n=1 Tax=Streptomyces lasiicapitis TaxID=1923961 RepID=A0ABQ2M6S8_9ACTN|nr:hypothetical protein [Streptomyces lasiicapitis]GGO47557.1 hypothetical protein GCM10012286_41130 [Streptomyces lasiicapitis]